MIPNALFDRGAIGPMRLRNRTVIAPMTRRQSPGGRVVTEELAIDHVVSIQDTIIPNIYDPAAIDRWADIARDVQAAGGSVRPPVLAHRRGALQIR